MNFTTIILCIIGLIFAIYFLRTVEGISNNKFRVEDLLITLLCLFAVWQAVEHNSEMKNYKDELFSSTYTVGYNDGYENAIKDAILWDADEYTYTISFDGELHEYANYYHED